MDNKHIPPPPPPPAPTEQNNEVKLDTSKLGTVITSVNTAVSTKLQNENPQANIVLKMPENETKPELPRPFTQIFKPEAKVEKVENFHLELPMSKSNVAGNGEKEKSVSDTKIESKPEAKVDVQGGQTDPPSKNVNITDVNISSADISKSQLKAYQTGESNKKDDKNLKNKESESSMKSTTLMGSIKIPSGVIGQSEPGKNVAEKKFHNTDIKTEDSNQSKEEKNDDSSDTKAKIISNADAKEEARNSDINNVNEPCKSSDKTNVHGKEKQSMEPAEVQNPDVTDETIKTTTNDEVVVAAPKPKIADEPVSQEQQHKMTVNLKTCTVGNISEPIAQKNSLQVEKRKKETKSTNIEDHVDIPNRRDSKEKDEDSTGNKPEAATKISDGNKMTKLPEQESNVLRRDIQSNDSTKMRQDEVLQIAKAVVIKEPALSSSDKNVEKSKMQSIQPSSLVSKGDISKDGYSVKVREPESAKPVLDPETLVKVIGEKQEEGQSKETDLLKVSSENRANIEVSLQEPTLKSKLDTEKGQLNTKVSGILSKSESPEKIAEVANKLPVAKSSNVVQEKKRTVEPGNVSKIQKDERQADAYSKNAIDSKNGKVSGSEALQSKTDSSSKSAMPRKDKNPPEETLRSIPVSKSEPISEMDKVTKITALKSTTDSKNPASHQEENPSSIDNIKRKAVKTAPREGDAPKKVKIQKIKLVGEIKKDISKGNSERNMPPVIPISKIKPIESKKRGRPVDSSEQTVPSVKIKTIKLPTNGDAEKLKKKLKVSMKKENSFSKIKIVDHGAVNSAFKQVKKEEIPNRREEKLIRKEDKKVRKEGKQIKNEEKKAGDDVKVSNENNKISDTIALDNQKRKTDSTDPGIEELIRSGTIKRIMKIDKDVKITATEAAFMVSKATELFLGKMMSTVHKDTPATTKKGTIQYNDIAKAVKNHAELEFLEDLLPEV